ncbi:hypothetical protein QQS21_003910 [Conoideocrella luteorostrata]|uniref:Uncharacterized protein n=1 Tax=Conoideocrella luteorostrata TaxID=1105319 RepID=A0AAJ0CVC6_9HYPO|nr:hypothetical protein QQS21_003910 [Conoideocrella luteorostrata]
MVMQDALIPPSNQEGSVSISAELSKDPEESTDAETVSSFYHTQEIATHDHPSTVCQTTTPATHYLSLPIEDFHIDQGNIEAFQDMVTPLSLTFDDQIDNALNCLLPSTTADHLGAGTPENEISLLVQFMEYSFPRQYSLHRPPSIVQKGWLMRLMLRSATFYSASLGMSAYYLYLSEPSDASFREMCLDSYQRHREMAIRNFEELCSTSSPDVGEVIICGVHISRLEALGKNFRSCTLYLERVAKYIGKQGHRLQKSSEYGSLLQQTLPAAQDMTSSAWSLAPGVSPCAPITQPSAMELDAEVFFVANFLWNDVLCSSVGKRMPPAADVYQRLLADGAFSAVFLEVTGCETWIMVVIMNIISLEVKKGEQVARGSLSMHGLVSQAHKIEEMVDQELARLSTLCQSQWEEEPNFGAAGRDHIQSLIYGHAVITFLNTVVSGALNGVPEIHQSITRAIPAWGMVPPTMNLRNLAWAYSTSASLATGAQREVFRIVAARMSHESVDAYGLHETYHGVEQCWKETDRHSSAKSNAPCDWRDIHQKLNLSIQFV